MNCFRLVKSVVLVLLIFGIVSCANTNRLTDSSSQQPEEKQTDQSGKSESESADLNPIEQSEESGKASDETEAAAAPADAESGSTLTLLFAGDVMAHTVNYSRGNFAAIWSDIAPLVQACDLAFANIEAPVSDSIEWNTYPRFNMHSSYVEAAIDAGFNVFSLANNHTNDQFLAGIKDTEKYFSGRSGIWACGIKSDARESLTFQIIDKDDWRVLFVAYTEILNALDYSKYIDYFPSDSESRRRLKNQLSEIARANPHDIFVVSVHTDEVEYDNSVSESHRQFFIELIEDCEVDVIWANHPHVIKAWEAVSLGRDPRREKSAFIMYANGNTISGQRYAPSLSKPHENRDNTGDGLLMRLTFQKERVFADDFAYYESERVKLSCAEPFFVTTYVNPSGQFVVKLLDDDLLHCLRRADLMSWSDYLFERKRLIEQIFSEQIYQLEVRFPNRTNLRNQQQDN